MQMRTKQQSGNQPLSSTPLLFLKPQPTLQPDICGEDDQHFRSSLDIIPLQDYILPLPLHFNPHPLCHKWNPTPSVRPLSVFYNLHPCNGAIFLPQSLTSVLQFQGRTFAIIYRIAPFGRTEPVIMTSNQMLQRSCADCPMSMRWCRK